MADISHTINFQVFGHLYIALLYNNNCYNTSWEKLLKDQ